MDEKKTNQQEQITELKKKFLEYFRQLPIQKLAAASVGRDETTIIRWKDDDANFANQIEVAKAEWALEKVNRVRSKEWILERVMKDHFAERKEMTGGDGEAIKVSLIDGFVHIPQTGSTTTSSD